MKLEPVVSYAQDKYPDLGQHYKLKRAPLSEAMLAAIVAALAVLMQGCGAPS